jgi:hypothetical protein
MRLFIISGEKIITESIKNKVNTIASELDLDYEAFISTKDFESYYIKVR